MVLRDFRLPAMKNLIAIHGRLDAMSAIEIVVPFTTAAISIKSIQPLFLETAVRFFQTYRINYQMRTNSDI